MGVRTQPLVSVRRHLPAGCADAKAEVCLVPFRRHERFVEIPNLLDAATPDDPRPNHGVDLLQAKPVQGARADCALQAVSVDQVLPPLDRGIRRKAIETATEAQQAEIVIGLERRNQLGNQPTALQEHVVLPRHDERRTTLSQSDVGTSQLMQVVLVEPPQVASAPGRIRQARQERRRSVGTAVFDDDDLHADAIGLDAPAFEAACKDGAVVVRRNDDRQRGLDHVCDPAMSGAAADSVGTCTSRSRSAAIVWRTSKRAS